MAGRAEVVTDELARLVAAIERHTPPDGICDTAVPGLLLARQLAPTDPIALVVDPSLCIVAQGAKEVFLAGEVYRYDPAHSLLVSIDLPISARVVEASPARPCLAVRVSLNLSMVGELLADCSDGPLRDLADLLAGDAADDRPAVGDEVEDADPGQGDQRLADGRVADAEARGQLLGDEVLAGPQGARLRQIAAAGAPAHQIARAIRWLRDHVADPLRGESLARQARMSLSGFHQHFKAVTGMSPLQYQKGLRLQEARRLMMDEGLDAASAAFRVGYESPSQFSREYRRLFGTPPRRDVFALKVVAQTSG